MIDWLLSTFSSTIAATALLSLLLFLSRNLILTRLKASVGHEFDAKLEAIRTDLRKSEESFKADLRAKEAQIDTLRSGALSVLASRQATLDKRRLEAVEQLWLGIEKLAPLKMASSMMASFDFTKSLKLASQEQKVRDFFSTMEKGMGIGPDIMKQLDVHKARPFVSELAWALFAAYQAILYHAVIQVQMLKVGADEPQLIDAEHVPKLAKAALPWCGDYIDKVGPAGYHHLLGPLEAELLKELQRMMRGEETDKTSIEQAARIMKEVTSVNEAISKSSTTLPA